jgi:hypothetical protein
MQHIGKSKIGSLSARKGVSYPQLRLPRKCIDAIGKTVDIFETESDGKCAFLIVTDQAMSKGGSVLKLDADVLKQCDDVAQPSMQIPARNSADTQLRFEAPESSKLEEKPLLSIPRVVSCAASSGYCAYACPGSVAAYHGALSRLRLGFKSRLGRFFFAYVLQELLVF